MRMDKNTTLAIIGSVGFIAAAAVAILSTAPFMAFWIACGVALAIGLVAEREDG